MAKGDYRVNRRRFKNAQKRVAMAKKPLVKMIRQVATKVANSGLETKFVSNEFNAIPFNSAITSGTEAYSCYPKLGPGTGQWQRIGLDVSPMRVENNWVVSINSVVRSVNVMVDLFILIDKNNRYYPQIPAAGVPNFLRSGNASGSGGCQSFNGFNTDSFKMINKERYTLLKHFRFQLCENVGQANGDITAGNAPNVALQSAKTLKYVVDTPKQLRYKPDSTIEDYPNGHAPFWVLGYSKVDGTAPDVVNQSITVSHSTTMIYKDA